MKKHDLILTTSGLLLPSNQHFSLIDFNKLTENSILNRNRNKITELDSELVSRIKTLPIYSSEAANKAFNSFKADKSFDNFIVLTEIASDSLNPISVKDFFLIQAENKYISPLTFMMLLEVANGNFEANHHRYATYSNSVRIIRHTAITSEEVKDNLIAMKRAIDFLPTTWNKFIPMLAKDKEAFASFFYCIFVSSV